MTKVVYHKTPVVAWDTKRIVLRSGGWMTVTTKLRMNQASNQFGLGYSVWQKDFAWFVGYQGCTLPFVDGMELMR